MFGLRPARSPWPNCNHGFAAVVFVIVWLLAMPSNAHDMSSTRAMIISHVFCLLVLLVLLDLLVAE